jgi:hypothetical protein
MRQFIIAVAMLSAASMSAFAGGQNGQGGNNNNQGGHYGAFLVPDCQGWRLASATVSTGW